MNTRDLGPGGDSSQKPSRSQPLRKEDARFLTGHGRYSDDINVDGQAWAAFIRSDHAHGRIRNIDVSGAKTHPGVIGIMTGQDLAASGVGGIRRLPLRGFDLGNPVETSRPGLAQDVVRFVGEPVVLVVAETIWQALDAAALVSVDIEQLPCVTDVEQAIRPGAPLLWPEATDNISIRWQSGDPKHVDDAFKRAAHVTSLKLRNTRVFANPIEPRSGIAQFNPVTQRYSWTGPTQGVEFFVRVLCDHVFSIPDHQMHISTPDVGGGFGVKEQPYPEDVALLHAARVLGRPIKWRGTRSENLISDNHARDAVIECSLALDERGQFLAVRARILAGMGAYFGCNGANGSIRNTTFGLPQVYKTPLMHVSVDTVMTNTAPVGPYRGAGREQASYIMERLVDEAARQLGVDRIELRRRNLIPKEAIPFKTPAGRTYDSGDFEGALDKALALADWDGFDGREAISRRKGLLRGRGVSCFLECVGSAPHEGAHIRFTRSGTIVIVVSTQSQGQGHETTFAQVVSDQLGIDASLIELKQGDSSDIPAGFGTIGSRSMIMAGSAISMACGVVVNKGREAAAHILEASLVDIEFEDGFFKVAGTDRRLALLDVARKLRDRGPTDTELPDSLDSYGAYTAPDVHFPNGCHICEIEVDPQTGVLRVDRYVAVDDVGTIINDAIVHGQVQGGVAQGLGQALLEHCQYDAEGQFLTGSFMDYAMPHAHDLPNITTAFHSTPSPKNPLGVKGSGECGVTGSIPAIMNAVADVLARAGVSTEIDMPVTADKLWRALKGMQHGATRRNPPAPITGGA